MLRPRVIPCLLLSRRGLVKTVKFKNPTYVGDPLNAIKIFNEKEADELIFLDIDATSHHTKPPFAILEAIASECFMPVCYGGGIRNVEDIQQIFKLGIEKVSISSAAIENPQLIQQAATLFGSQSIVVCIDILRNLFGKYEVVTYNARKRTGIDPIQHASHMEKLGAGELLINSVDKDGTMSGYDVPLIQKIIQSVSIPIIVCGGAGKVADLKQVISLGEGVSAAAGSMFVFYGEHRAVLINYSNSLEVKDNA